MKQEVISKETIYNGYRFRSRLEARWAVFFDKLAIPYQYEPEAFLCEDGSQYTPDFLLPESYLRGWHKGLYLEIKHAKWNPSDRHIEIKRISSALKDLPLVLYCGDPFDVLNSSYDNLNEQLCPDWDDCMTLQYCNACGILKAEYSESNYAYCPVCEGKTASILAEAEQARQFRFQFHK